MSKKNDLPAMPFYFGDWFKAMDVQSLPRDTKCVWFEMLGRMWESNERGHLTINGKPMTDFAIAKILGFGDDVKEYRKHEKILEESGIFSRREDGAIYSRFMLKLIDISEKRSQSGSKGANKRYGKQLIDAMANGIANPETESEDETENVVVDLNVKKIFRVGAFFEAVWEAYPDKTGRKSAFQHFQASVKTEDDVGRIVRALENYKKSARVTDGYIQNGSTWFNDWQGWENPTEQMMKGKNGTTRQGGGSAYKPARGTQAARLAYDPNSPEAIAGRKNLQATIEQRDRERRERAGSD